MLPTCMPRLRQLSRCARSFGSYLGKLVRLLLETVVNICPLISGLYASAIADLTGKRAWQELV